MTSPCPMAAKPSGNKPRTGWLRWAFPAAGLVSLIWFLFRVVAKPSRAAYPTSRRLRLWPAGSCSGSRACWPQRRYFAGRKGCGSGRRSGWHARLWRWR